MVLSNRQKKVSELIQRDLAEFLAKYTVNFGGIVSVSGVFVSADLGIAKVYISIFPAKFRKSFMKEIEQNTSIFRDFIGRKMANQVRRIPQLKFYLDTTLDDVEKIEKELKGEGDMPIL